MKKVLLMLDCDFCRELYGYTRTASEDTTAWDVHGDAIVRMALKDGWECSEDYNSHYCPDCCRFFSENVIIIDASNQLTSAT